MTNHKLLLLITGGLGAKYLWVPNFEATGISKAIQTILMNPELPHPRLEIKFGIGEH